MTQDTMRLTSPAAKKELELLKTMKVGDKRWSTLFPALEDEVVWVCTAVEDNRWTFEGRFMEELMFTAIISLESDALTLMLVESV